MILSTTESIPNREIDKVLGIARGSTVRTRNVARDIVAQIKNLIGFAVVADVPVAKANAEVEKLFLNKPFEIFQSLDKAITWANNILNIEENNIKSI